MAMRGPRATRPIQISLRTTSGGTRWPCAQSGRLFPERASEFEEFYSGAKGGEGAIRGYIAHREDEQDTLTDSRTERFRRGLSQQVFLLKAAADRLYSMLADIRGVLEAEIFDTALDGARELFAKKHLRAAGVVAGVVLETHLKDVCRNHNVKLRKQKPSIGDLNDALKNEGIYDMPPWRRVQHLADIRNLCGHDREREPTSEEVEDLLRGVAWATKTLF